MSDTEELTEHDGYGSENDTSEVTYADGTLTVHAKYVKKTTNYYKYDLQLQEDPAEMLPNKSVYIGVHFENPKRIIIELDKE